MSIGTVIPEKRNTTLTSDEVRRKTFAEKFATAFNEDQCKVLLSLLSDTEESAEITALSTAIDALETEYTALEARVAALEPEPESDSEEEQNGES